MSIQGFCLSPLGNYHLGIDQTPEQMIDAWASIRSQKPTNRAFVTTQLQVALKEFLRNPQINTLNLYDVDVEPLLNILAHPAFSSRLNTLTFQECSMSSDCSQLDPFFEKIVQFPNLRKLAFWQCEIQEFSQLLCAQSQLGELELRECLLSTLSPESISITLFLDPIRANLNQAAPIISKLCNNVFFKRTVFDYLTFANKDAVFRESFFEIVNREEIVGNEVDYALSIQLIHQTFRLRHAFLCGITSYCQYLIETVRPQEVLRNYVALHVQQHSSFDPRETYMTYLEKLKPIFEETLEYFPSTNRSSSLSILEVDQQKATDYLKDQLSNRFSICDYLMSNPVWLDLLHSQFRWEIELASQQGPLALRNCQAQWTERVLNEIDQNKQASFYPAAGKRKLDTSSFACKPTLKRAYPKME